MGSQPQAVSNYVPLKENNMQYEIPLALAKVQDSINIEQCQWIHLHLCFPKPYNLEKGQHGGQVHSNKKRWSP